MKIVFRALRCGALCAAAFVLSACNSWPFAPPPAPTPRPTRTSVPTRTPVPSRTPRPTRTPAATRTPAVVSTAQAPLSVVVTVIVTTTPDKPVQAPRRPVSRAPQKKGAPWFFAPHPDLALRNLRRYGVDFQTFERGAALYIREKGETWVFSAPGQISVAEGRIWSNRGGDLTAVASSFGLGQPLGQKATFDACAGDVLRAGHVTAYMALPNRRILSWTLQIDGFVPKSWSYLQADWIGDCVDTATPTVQP